MTTTKLKPVELLCYGCGATGLALKVTAGLQCRCGSKDLDLYTGSLEQREASWALQSAGNVSFADWMTTESFVNMLAKQGLQEGPQQQRRAPVGDDIPGWNEYAGPRPGPSGESNGVGTPMTCPTCHGSGFAIQDGGECRTCGGSGTFTPNTTAEPPAVARHNYPSNQTTVPFMGKKRAALMDIPDVACTRCSRPTSIVADAAKQAWWHCASCGPLHNLDANPHLDPYRPPAQFTANAQGFATKKNASRKVGELAPLIDVIRAHNPGLSAREILTLGRQTLTYARTAEKS